MKKREKYLVFGEPLIEEEEIEEVVRTLKSCWIGTGPKTFKFENDFKNYVQNDYAIALNSCTAALHLACIALETCEKDEIITTPMTFCATVNAIIHSGATPVLADVEPDSMVISPNEIRKKITKNTKAILPVHFAGYPCAMEEIREIANEHGLKIIGDCAHAVETELGGKNISQFSDINCYSFYVNKNITSAEGGMVTTNDEVIANKIKVLALHGMDKDAWKRYSDDGFKHYQVVYAGYKYNMPDLMASLAIHQLQKIDRFHKRRKEIWEIYQNELKNSGLTLPVCLPESKGKHAYHLFTVRTGETTSLKRDGWVSELHNLNIGTGIHYQAVFEHLYYKNTFGWNAKDFPFAKSISDTVFSLPLTPKLTDNDVAYVIEAVKFLFKKYKK